MVARFEVEYDPDSWEKTISEQTSATVSQVYSALATACRRWLKSGGGGYVPVDSGELRRSYSVTQRKSRSQRRRVIEVTNRALPRRRRGNKRKTGFTRAQNIDLAGFEAGRYAGILENAREIRGYYNRHFQAGQNAISRNWDMLLTDARKIAIMKAASSAERRTAKQKATLARK